MKMITSASSAIFAFLFSRLVIPVALFAYYCLATGLFLVSRSKFYVRAYIREVIDSFQNFVHTQKEKEAHMQLKSRVKKFLH